MTDFTLTDADSGQILAGAPVSGAITGLKLTASPDYRSWNTDKNSPDYWLSLGGDAETSTWARIQINLLDNFCGACGIQLTLQRQIIRLEYPARLYRCIIAGLGQYPDDLHGLSHRREHNRPEYRASWWRLSRRDDAHDLGPRPILNTDRAPGLGGAFSTNYLQLRADGELRDSVCINPNNTPLGAYAGQPFVSGSYRYEGTMRVLCCPAGFTFSATLSDIPVLTAYTKGSAG